MAEGSLQLRTDSLTSSDEIVRSSDSATGLSIEQNKSTSPANLRGSVEGSRSSLLNSSRTNSPLRYPYDRQRHPAAGPTPHRSSPSSSPVFKTNKLPSTGDSDVRAFAIQGQGTSFPFVRVLHSREKLRILVTGGAGFVGSHLVDRLMQMGHDVLVLDNYFTGQKSNLSHWVGHPNFEMVRHDVVNPIMFEVDQIYHLACPASPPHYQANQIKTIKTNFLGTSNMLGLAKRTKARFLLASTSEVYGDPDVSPQKETYNGNVNQTGPRACYDEGKRVAETLAYGYLYQDNVDIRVARIFNTYGPRMNPYDGRIMSNILMQALKEEPLTVYGDGSQTRSFCYIEDLIDGLIALMNADSHKTEGKESATLPVNLGSDVEITIRELVDIITSVLDEINQSRQVSPAKHKIQFSSLPVDDPRQRRPDITRANQLLDWSPKWKLRDGIKEMALSYLDRMDAGEL